MGEGVAMKMEGVRVVEVREWLGVAIVGVVVEVVAVLEGGGGESGRKEYGVNGKVMLE